MSALTICRKTNIHRSTNIHENTVDKKVITNYINTFRNIFGTYLNNGVGANITISDLSSSVFICIVITAFNAGNIHEAVSHMNDAPTTIGDTIRWGIVLCSDWIKNVKAKNFTWDVKQIFMPFVGAVIYCGAKIIKRIYRIMKWIKSHKIVNTAVKATKPAPTMTVADPFGTM